MEVLVILAEWLWVAYVVKTTTIITANEIKTNFKFFPKHYAMPPRWLRKHYKLKKTEIPKYWLFRLYLAFAIKVMAPVAALVALFSFLNSTVVYIILFLPGILLPDLIIIWPILTLIYKKQ